MEALTLLALIVLAVAIPSIIQDCKRRWQRVLLLLFLLPYSLVAAYWLFFYGWVAGTYPEAGVFFQSLPASAKPFVLLQLVLVFTQPLHVFRFAWAAGKAKSAEPYL